MPFAIDQEALESPNMKVLDINKPPVKSISHQPYPKMVYLHPVDKTREHRFKTVANPQELDAATKEGWRIHPHVPTAAPDIEIERGDFETTEVKTRRNKASEVA